MIKKLALAGSALSLAAAPLAAQADTASRVSTANAQESQLEGGLGVGWLVAAAIAGLITVVAVTSDDDDQPTSP